MKKFKMITALCMALAVAFVFAGCSNSAESSAVASESAVAESVAAESVAAESVAVESVPVSGDSEQVEGAVQENIDEASQAQDAAESEVVAESPAA